MSEIHRIRATLDDVTMRRLSATGEGGGLSGGLKARGDRAESATGFCLFYIETK